MRGTPDSKPGFIGYLKLTILGFALSALWSTLHTIVLPIRLLDVVSEAKKNSYLGLLTFSGLIVAMVTQPLIGALSDRTNLACGRRRPYILLGVVLSLLVLPFIGLTKSYLALFLSYLLLQLATNTAQAPYQAFIPEFVPLEKRGHASGVKSLLEILGGVILLYPVAHLIDAYTATRETLWLFLTLGIMGTPILSAGVATVTLLREPSGAKSAVSPFSLRTYLKTRMWHDPRLRCFLLSRLLFFLAFTTIQTFALYFLRDVVGVKSPAVATASFSAPAVLGMVLSAYPAGGLSDRLGRRPIGVISGLLGASGILLIMLFRGHYFVIITAAGLLGIAFGTFLSTNWALATDLVRSGEEGVYLGLTNLATAGGSALARPIGLLIDFFNGLKTNSGYMVMLFICLGALLLSSWLLAKKVQ